MSTTLADPYAPPQAPPAPRRRSRSRLARYAGSAPTGRAPVRPRPPSTQRVVTGEAAAVTSSAAALVAILCGWFALQLFVLGGLEQARSQQVLHAELREQLAAQTAPTGGAIEAGRPVALLAVPTIGLQQVVVEGTASGDLLTGPGHRRDTVLPGQAGVSIIYGRTTTYGAPLRSIRSLQEGDGIQVTTGQGEFVYRVDGVRREGDPVPQPPKRGGGRLTFVTAEGSGALLGSGPTRAVYVDATLTGDGVVGPAGRPASIPESEKALAGDPSVLPVLALGLQGALLAGVGTILARRRWPARVVWVIAAPVLVALAWVVTGTAVQLLPNLV